MADLNLERLQRTIYDQQSQTWSPVQDALLEDYNDFAGRTDRIADAGQEAELAATQSAGAETRQLARFGPLSTEAQAYRERMRGLQTAKDVVTARGMARSSEEARRVNTGLALTKVGTDTLSQGMSALAVADSMKSEREAIDAEKKRSKRSGLAGMAGTVIGGVAGAVIGGPAGAMAGMSAGGSIGSGLA